MDPFQCIMGKLQAAGVPYQIFEHEPVRTSQEAAAIRNTKLEEGAKALVCHATLLRRPDEPRYDRGDEGSRDTQNQGADQPRRFYVLAVIAAHLQADLGMLRKHLGAKKLALASPEEVLRETGCEVGGVPPFGSCIGLPTYCDPSLAQNEQISFNAGRRTHSVVMRYADYAALEQLEVVPFARA